MVYAWPGNVRELANTVERLIIMADRQTIIEIDLPAGILYPAGVSSSVASGNGNCPEDLGDQVNRLEQRKIIEALKSVNGVQQAASRILGITPRQLGYRIRK